jgi:hypothetical protein
MKEKEAKQIIESEFGNLKKESRSQYDTLVFLLVKYGADASRPVEKLGYSEGVPPPGAVADKGEKKKLLESWDYLRYKGFLSAKKEKILYDKIRKRCKKFNCW